MKARGIKTRIRDFREWIEKVSPYGYPQLHGLTLHQLRPWEPIATMPWATSLKLISTSSGLLSPCHVPPELLFPRLLPLGYLPQLLPQDRTLAYFFLSSNTFENSPHQLTPTVLVGAQSWSYLHSKRMLGRNKWSKNEFFDKSLKWGKLSMA